jgi:hypothetical protein
MNAEGSIFEMKAFINTAAAAIGGNPGMDGCPSH